MLNAEKGAEKMRNKIGFSDTGMDMFVKLAEGNPGALRVCMEIVSKGPQIDPDSAHPMLTLMHFDDLGIYGPRIWMLYKDVCGEDLINTLGVLRGHQFGFITEDTLNHAIDTRGDGLDVEAIVTKVKEALPKFGNSL